MLSTSSLYALVIGIDTNAQGDSRFRTSGASSDAYTVARFLWEHLGVNKANVKLLVDAQATRAETISAFHEHLIDNMDIKKQDPILIYFAGNGSRYIHDGGIIEAICPYDRGSQAYRGGPVIPDIADCTLAKLLSILSEEKGNNVTVVMDCCYPASEQTDVEGMNGQLLRARCLPPIPGDSVVAEMLTEPSGSSLLPYIATDDSIDPSGAKRLLRQEYTTHVLLTACNQDECAYEDITTRSGLFTSALVAELSNAMSQSNLSLRTHQMLIRAIRASKPLHQNSDVESTALQQPQCYGNQSHSVLFYGKLSRHRKDRYQLHRSQSRHQDSATMWVAQGALHGISHGTEFAVWPSAFDRPSSDKPLAIVVAKQVHFSWSTVVASRDVPLPEGSLFVEVVWWANTEVPLDVQFGGLGCYYPSMVGGLLEGLLAGIRMAGIEVAVKHAKNAALLFSVQDEQVKVQRRGHQGIVTWKYPEDYDLLAKVNRALRFEMHLNRTNTVHPLRNFVTVDLLGLEQPEMTKIPHQAREGNKGLCDMRTDGKEGADRPRYGVRVRNTSSQDLCAAVHWFDSAYHSISGLDSPKLLEDEDSSVGSDRNIADFVINEPLKPETICFARVYLWKHRHEDTLEQVALPTPGVPSQFLEHKTIKKDDWDTLTVAMTPFLPKPQPSKLHHLG